MHQRSVVGHWPNRSRVCSFLFTIFTVFAILFLQSMAQAGIQLSDPAQVIVDNTARFTVVSPGCIRLEYSQQGVFIDAPSLFAMNRSARDPQARIITEKNGITITTKRLTLTYTPNGYTFSPSNLQISYHSMGEPGFTWTPGMPNKNNLGGTLNNLDHIKAAVPVYDGLLSRDGWYLLEDSQRTILTPQNGELWPTTRPQGAGIDAYFFGYGVNYKDALKDLTQIGGEIPLPRKYVLGAWYSRWWKYTSQDYRDIVGEFHSHDFPLDMVVMDMDWHLPNTWTGYTWNRNLFPDAEDYLKWLHSQNLHATFNDHPQNSVGAYEARYNGFMLAMGKDPNTREVLPFNMGDQKFINTLFDYMHKPLEKQGVDFWWLDWMGGIEFPFNRVDWVNEYYFRHSTKSGSGDNLRGQLFARWADWGDHRHPIHFSGDSHSDWPTLQFEVPFTASSSNVGAFFWSHDMGGFEGPPNGELLSRWVQFGAFSAALRMHSIDHWDEDKRPWKYSPEAESSMHTAFHLRSIFFPYTYSAAWQAHHETLPLIRSLYLDYPLDENAYHQSQEYLYGDSILVAPITRAGTNRSNGNSGSASQSVYFPKGLWYDWFTGQSYQGEQTKSFTHTLATFPLFIKGGMPIVMQPYTERMTTEPLKTLVVRVYPGEEGQLYTSELYEDDGTTNDYAAGQHAITQLSYLKTPSDFSLKINATNGKYNGQMENRLYIIELPWWQALKRVFVNGQEVSAQYDSVAGVNRIFLPLHSIRDALEVKVIP